MTVEEKLIWTEKYRTLATGAISDAMDSLGLKRGAVQGLRPLESHQPRTAGFARTIRQQRRQTPWDGQNLAKQGNIIDTRTEPGDLLVIDMDGITDVATGGDLLSLRAKLRGVTGELTNGCLRDADEIAAMQFPVYCAGTVPVKSAFDIETAALDVPVVIGGVQIIPGDLVVMDRTGVMVVPAAKIAEVYDIASHITASEDLVAELLREGKSLAQARQQASE